MVTKGFDGCLFVFAQDGWEKFEEKLQALPMDKPEARMLGRFFIAGAIDAEGLVTVRNVLTAIGRWSVPATLLTPLAVFFLLLGFALQLLDGETPRRLWNAFNRLPPLVQGLLAAILLTIVIGLGPAGVAPFIYFQF